MMRYVRGLAAVALVGMLPLTAQALQVGGGVHYFKTIDELDGPFAEDGLTPVISIKGDLGVLLHPQLDVELFDEGYAGSTDGVLAPQAFLLLGGALYGGLGVGTLISDGEFGDPFFVVRAGFDLALLPGLHLDLNANYHFAEWEQINEIDEDADSDTITLGAALRLDL